VTEDTRTEADAIAEHALAAAIPHELDIHETYSVIMPAGSDHKVLDLEHLRAVPRRKRGKLTVFTGESFVAYVMDHLLPKDDGGDMTRLYADVEQGAVVGVLNDAGNDPGWGDHRVTLQLRHSPAWKHWSSRHKVLGGQVEFAEHIEDGLDDIRDPAAADMLELAQHFEASQQVSFRSASRLANGIRQLTYDEDLTAKAGHGGQIEIPEVFKLAIAPYEGSELFEVRARLRYRIHDGKLNIGYVLDRPDLVLEVAFAAVLDHIQAGVSLQALRGRPPECL
jgi:uncharacterized protein YfdQ (DUF2303 family)